MLRGKCRIQDYVMVWGPRYKLCTHKGKPGRRSVKNKSVLSGLLDYEWVLLYSYFQCIVNALIFFRLHILLTPFRIKRGSHTLKWLLWRFIQSFYLIKLCTPPIILGTFLLSVVWIFTELNFFNKLYSYQIWAVPQETGMRGKCSRPQEPACGSATFS